MVQKKETTNDDELPFKLINLSEPDFGKKSYILPIGNYRIVT